MFRAVVERLNKLSQDRPDISFESSFHCLVEQWKDCEERSSQSREREREVDFCGSEEGGDEASDGMLCGSR